MNKKKRIIYVIVAVVFIIAGLYLERKQEGDTGSTQDSEHNYAAETNDGILMNSEEESSEVLTDNASSGEESSGTFTEDAEDYVAYYFRNDDLLEQHYEKHGMEMGFESMEAYEEAASAVIYHPDVLSKTEEEDGDYVYYVEESNEFVVVSKDGYIRTYFNPSAGIEYYNRQ